MNLRFNFNGLFRRAAQGDSETRLSTEARVALFIHGCFQFGASMSGLFLNLYLWRLTEDLTINGMFNLIVYGVTPAAFAVGGWIAKKKDRMVTYRLGIASITVFFLVVIFAQENVVVYYPLFGVLNGFALGLYWTGYIVLMYDVTTIRNRSRFMGVNMIVFNSAGLAGPALSGFLIGLFEGLSGYLLIFGFASALFGLASLFSLKIRAVPAHHRSYYLSFAGPMMKKSRLWLKSLIAFFLLGLSQGLMLFLPNILMFQTVGREDQVGYLTVFFALLTIATGYAISRRRKPVRIRRELTAASLCIVAGAAVLFVDIKLWTVVLFMSIYSIMAPFIVNMLTTYYYSVMDELPLKGLFRIESVVVRELFLNVGRVLSILTLILFVKEANSPMLPTIVVVTSLTLGAMALFVRSRKEIL
ncbi:MFS transporter [Cohnella hongkongensis]|uniref:MFS transporter n=1 Tax=Cohnella hongkongensis TaxID=178337 RepID=A0ABV9FAX3_9BACL